MKLSEEIKELHNSGDAGNWCEGWAEKVEAMENALETLSSDEAWRINGVCDPNGPNFNGQGLAQDAIS